MPQATSSTSEITPPVAKRLHGPPEPSPVPRAQRAGDDEIQALAKHVRRAMPEQRLGTRTPPRNAPFRIDDNDGVIRHDPILHRSTADPRNFRIWNVPAYCPASSSYVSAGARLHLLAD
jgi:hypothetical protein